LLVERRSFLTAAGFGGYGLTSPGHLPLRAAPAEPPAQRTGDTRSGAREEADFYVSPQGRDDWSGRSPVPKRSGSDGPFATLARARDAVRQLEAKRRQDVVVLIRGGLYPAKQTIVFGPQDSPRHGFRTRYAAFPGERPIFSAAVTVRGWRRTEKAYPGIAPTARGKIWMADIPALPNGKKRFYTLYDGNRRLLRARSAAFFPLPQKTPQPTWRATREAKSLLRFPNGALRNWPNLDDVEVFLFPTWGFTVNYLGIKSVDEARGLAWTRIPASAPIAPPPHHYQLPEFGKGSCVVENQLEFLDRPGAWAVDTRVGKIYLWPLEEEPGDNIQVPGLTEMIRVEGDEPGERLARNLIFQGLTFSHGDRDVWREDDKGLQHDWEMWDKANALLRFRNAENCAVRGCRFTASGGTGIRLDLHCQDIELRDNLLEHLGATGILLCGYGPGTKDVNKHNRILNNHIHHCGELYYHSPGIMAWQSGGNRICRNLIHHLPYDAIVLDGVRIYSFDRSQPRREMSPTIRWEEVDARLAEPAKRGDELFRRWPLTLPYQHTRNNLVANNEIFQVMQKLEDGNAIYLSDTGTGNLIKRNYIHHMNGPGWNQAIRTDAWTTGTLITQNLIYNVAGGGINTKYYNNHVLNNVIVRIRDIIRTQPDGSWRRIFFGYLSLLGITPRQAVPPHGGTRIRHNILYKGNPNQTFYRLCTVGGRQQECHVRECDIDRNLYFSSTAADGGETALQRYRALGVDHNSLAADPHFVDLNSGDFRLAPDSPALRIGFHPFDYGSIGLSEVFPAWLEEVVRAELGDDYRDFQKLETICRGSAYERRPARGGEKM